MILSFSVTMASISSGLSITSLDRISRDQEDIAGVYKRLRFAGVQILTLSEGPVSELHIGFKGTMGALYLKDLADKTRRGLRGRVEAGKSGGGNSYGYDVVVNFSAAGEPERGDRRINEREAAIVRHIFTATRRGSRRRQSLTRSTGRKSPAPQARAGLRPRSTATGGAAPAS
jgi:DNA invertase Pin-like site-specific DNA recombinase